ncbi:ankyrin 2,3/unc44 [Ophiocordyceps camponoti-floridani]|uniref:Ankyrin 2,3/unc44 n=1 Tax=Ophiocordyceps camponoti-floridani TaxID=2030778 RepID=A0A8H4QC79_9HYPO|nr:ankyrin 2,3/unc44 [Ophiocordyceps camponoti-floridani]
MQPRILEQRFLMIDEWNRLGMTPETHKRWLVNGPEIEAHDELVRDGGRPIYSVDLLDEVMDNPRPYEELQMQWQRVNGAHDIVCSLGNQLRRWKEFRQWQRFNRGIADDPIEFSVWLKDKLKSLKSYKPNDELTKIERDPSFARTGYEKYLERHQRFWQKNRGQECHDFPSYMKAVKRRLARHGFTRSFLLKEDAKIQDRLATWIEYLNFEYWGLDQYHALAEEQRLNRDKAWVEIVAANIVDLRELPIFMRASERFRQPSAEVAHHDKAVEDAKMLLDHLFHLIREDPDMGNELDVVHKRMKSFVQNYRHLDEFEDYAKTYRCAMRDVDLQKGRLQWVLEQIPLIEAESETETRGSKRSRSTEEDESSKRQTTSRIDAVREPRRSARIAARRNDSSSAKAPAWSGRMKKKRHFSTGERRSRRTLAAKGDEV